MSKTKKPAHVPTTLERIQSFTPTPVSPDQLAATKKLAKKVDGLKDGSKAVDPKASFPFDTAAIKQAKKAKATKPTSKRKVTYVAPLPTVGLNATVTVKPKAISFKIGKQVIGVGDKWMFRRPDFALRTPLNLVTVSAVTPYTFTVRYGGDQDGIELSYAREDFAKGLSPFVERIVSPPSA